MSSLQRFPCAQCGALLAFEPGTTVLKCGYCGCEQAIAPPAHSVEETDIMEGLKASSNPVDYQDQLVQCDACAAQFLLAFNVEAGQCPFCGSNVVVQPQGGSWIRPIGLMPFVVDEKLMRTKYKEWVSSRFWAPNNLKHRALQKNEVRGIYVPYWTFDAQTTTHYTGMRGDDYYTTETYRDSNGNTQTRSVRRTRWSPAAGTVFVPFDDVLVVGTTHLPHKYTDAMSSWNLTSVTAYDTAYLAGFQAMRYDIDLEMGFEGGKRKMAVVIDQHIRMDIGGDHQQIHTRDTHYANVTFKHILLPIWSGAYRYNNRIWNFLVNGQTGEVRGEAPVSFWKVFFAVLLGLIIIGTIIYFSKDK